MTKVVNSGYNWLAAKYLFRVPAKSSFVHIGSLLDGRENRAFNIASHKNDCFSNP